MVRGTSYKLSIILVEADKRTFEGRHIAQAHTNLGNRETYMVTRCAVLSVSRLSVSRLSLSRLSLSRLSVSRVAIVVVIFSLLNEV